MKSAFPPARILVAVDLSSPSLAALAAARDAAARFDAVVEAVYAEAPSQVPPYAYDNLDATAARLMKQEDERFRAEWRRRMEALSEKGRGKFKATWAVGWPAEVIGKLAAPARADLLVVGTHGRAGASRALFGSIAETLLRRVRVPVLCVHAGAPPMLSRGVLAPYRPSPEADRALAYASQLAAAARTKLTVLSVLAKGQEAAEARAALGEDLRRVLGGAAGRCQLLLRRGEPRARIAAVASRGDYGVVVLSAHVRPSLGDRLLGSTAERLLRRTRTAVLAVPAVPAVPARAAARKPRRGRGVVLFG